MAPCFLVSSSRTLVRGLRLAGVALVAVVAVGCGTIKLPGGAVPPAPAVGVEVAPVAPPAAEPRAVRPVPAAPADAVPRVERIPQGAPNQPYEIRGETYLPDNGDVPLFETGIASWYGAPFHGRRTATGEVYDMNRMTAAHKTMPLPSYALVRNRANGKQVVVRVNDRGPFIDGRVIDLSHAAARKLGIRGVGEVELRRLTHGEIRTGSWKKLPQTVAVGDERNTAR
ncbi:septal ring lytic transglycosylase RlpA family protein [Methylibium sp.]|uniref:septal ring lytic transglycosylase RlpA family protein n=1 Tax=Methylibium sp. TaxID=2067992 RepID=UPI003D102FEE